MVTWVVIDLENKAVLQSGALSKKRVQVNTDASLWNCELRSERETRSTCIGNIAKKKIAEWKVQCESTQKDKGNSPP